MEIQAKADAIYRRQRKRRVRYIMGLLPVKTRAILKAAKLEPVSLMEADKMMAKLKKGKGKRKAK